MSEESRPNPLRPLSLPEVPAPSATYDDVQIYLTEYLYNMSRCRTRDEAERDARKIEANGEIIYEIPLEEWKEKLGWAGVQIRNELITSSYGFDGGYWPVLQNVARMFFCLGVSGGVCVWLLQKFLSLAIAFFILTWLIVIFSTCCERKFLIKWQQFPDKLKIRNGKERPRLWEIWKQS